MPERVPWGDAGRLAKDSAAATLRFPVASLGIGLMTLSALLLIHLGRSGLDGQLVPWLFRIGIALTMAGILAGLSVEGLRWSRAVGAGIAVALAIAIVAHGWLHPADDAHALLIAGLLVGLFALPSMAAGHERDRAWAYGSHLLGCLVFASLVALVLWSGLLLLQGFLLGLLQVPLSLLAWVDTAVLAFVTVLPLVALARVADPADVALPLSEPAWLSRFTIWLCVPLALAYLALLEIYALRVLVTWDLSVGRVAGLTMGIALLGVLAHLLAYPLRQAGPRWVRVYHRFFYPALIPILLILAIAAWQQIEEYGITEQRYLCCLLLLWLAILTVFSLRERWWRPVLVPALLALLLVAAGAGPWTPRAMAIASQLARLEALLDKAGLIHDGLLVDPRDRDGAVEPTTARALQAIVTFLVARHGQDRIAPLWPDPPDWTTAKASAPRDRADLEKHILADLGVPPDVAEARPAHFRNPEQRTFDVAGFELGGSLRVTRTRPPEPALLATAAGSFALAFDRERQELQVSAPDGSAFAFALAPLAERLAATTEQPTASFALEQASDQHRVRLLIRILDGNWLAGTSDFELKHLEAFILVE